MCRTTASALWEFLVQIIKHGERTLFYHTIMCEREEDYLSISLYLSLYLYLSISIYICLSINLSVYLSVYIYLPTPISGATASSRTGNGHPWKAHTHVQKLGHRVPFRRIGRHEDQKRSCRANCVLRTFIEVLVHVICVMNIVYDLMTRQHSAHHSLSSTAHRFRTPPHKD